MSSVLIEKSVLPDDKLLSRVLGASFALWQEIDDSIRKTYGATHQEWKYYGAKSGWTLKLLLKKRNLFFLSPQDKHFLVAFVFGDRAVEAVGKSDLPPAMIKELNDARRYAEGRGLLIDVRSRAAVKRVLRLVDIKVEH